MARAQGPRSQHQRGVADHQARRFVCAGRIHQVGRFRTVTEIFEVDDPSAFTKPWKGELTMERAEGPIFEYACHEGNYALPNLLRGFRAAEKR